MHKNEENIRVLLRIRPVQEGGEESCIKCTSCTDLAVKIPNQPVSQFSCDRCFGEKCSQRDFFQNSGIIGILDHVLQGFSSTIFAYGPTGNTVRDLCGGDFIKSCSELGLFA